jgi:hypothetical protein
MIDEIICIGTSFTWGDGLDTKRNKEFVKWYKENTNQIISRETHAFPALLQTLTNIKTRNLGKCGSSIEYVCRNVEELLERENLSNKLLILEYANWGRAELWSNKYQKYIIANWGPSDGHDVTKGYSTYLTIDYAEEYDNTPGALWDFRDDIKVYNKFCDSFMDEKEFLIKNDRMFLNLLYKLQTKGIKFLIVPLEQFFTDILEKDEIVLNNSELFYFNNENYGMAGYISNLGLRIHDEILDSNESHPSPKGHQIFSEKIYQNLLNKNIL